MAPLGRLSSVLVILVTILSQDPPHSHLTRVILFPCLPGNMQILGEGKVRIINNTISVSSYRSLVLKEPRCSTVLKITAKDQIYLAVALEKARHPRILLKSRYFVCSNVIYGQSCSANKTSPCKISLVQASPKGMFTIAVAQGAGHVEQRSQKEFVKLTEKPTPAKFLSPLQLRPYFAFLLFKQQMLAAFIYRAFTSTWSPPCFQSVR